MLWAASGGDRLIRGGLGLALVAPVQLDPRWPEVAADDLGDRLIGGDLAACDLQLKVVDKLRDLVTGQRQCGVGNQRGLLRRGRRTGFLRAVFAHTPMVAAGICAYSTENTPTRCAGGLCWPIGAASPP